MTESSNSYRMEIQGNFTMQHGITMKNKIRDLKMKIQRSQEQKTVTLTRVTVQTDKYLYKDRLNEANE